MDYAVVNNPNQNLSNRSAPTHRGYLAIFLMGVTLLSSCNATPTGGGGPGVNLVGVWQANFFDPTFGAGSVELILGATGEFQQQTIYQAGSLVTIFGTFRVFENEALLRLDIAGGEPSEFCGPLECTPILYPAGESHAYTVNADGTLTLTNINCTPGLAVCTFNYARAV